MQPVRESGKVGADTESADEHGLGAGGPTGRLIPGAPVKAL